MALTTFLSIYLFPSSQLQVSSSALLVERVWRGPSGTRQTRSHPPPRSWCLKRGLTSFIIFITQKIGLTSLKNFNMGKTGLTGYKSLKLLGKLSNWFQNVLRSWSFLLDRYEGNSQPKDYTDLFVWYKNSWICLTYLTYTIHRLLLPKRATRLKAHSD